MRRALGVEFPAALAGCRTCDTRRQARPRGQETTGRDCTTIQPVDAEGPVKNLPALPAAIAFRSLLLPVLLSANCASTSIVRTPPTLSAHPRLVATDQDWARLARERGADPLLDSLTGRIVEEARRTLHQTPVVYEKRGRRLLAVSRRAEQRILSLAFARRVTGESAFARRAEEELLTVARFPDWNPSHFLDVAEMTAAVALGYDWLYSELPPETRTELRRAIVEKGLLPGTEAGARWNRWWSAENNWNQVCFAGITLGALAIVDEEPATAERALSLARTNIQSGLRPYAPDGVFPEGPGYWSYGTTYQVLMIEALRTALGDDWGLSASEGFLESASVLVQITGPSGRPFNYADGGDHRSFEPALFWFARRPGMGGLVAGQRRLLSEAGAGNLSGDSLRFLPLAALWWGGTRDQAAPTLPAAWAGRGTTPLVVLRRGGGPTALFLAAKGGSASSNHAHMDAGSFVLELAGVRWAVDLGAQDYESLESQGVDLWNRAQGSQRWQVFRLSNRSHNTLVIDDQLQRVDGAARVVEVSDAPAPHAVLDLLPVYLGQAQRVRRRFDVSDRGVLVTDELSGLRPGADVRWAMVTRAAGSAGGSRALLRQDGHSLSVTLQTPSAGRLEVIAADPPPASHDAPNPGVSLVVSHLRASADGELRIVVALDLEQ